MRILPDMNAMKARLRRPWARQLGVGMTLLLPASLWLATAPQPRPANQDGLAEIGEVTRTWAAREMEAQRTSTIESLASTFRVELPLAEDIHDAAVNFEIDPEVAFGLVQAESSFRKAVVSPVGAVGLTQVMPATARDVEPGTTRGDLMNPEVNLRIGFKYLRQLLEKYEGDQELALTAYNRGPGTVDRLLERGRDPDNGYAEKVLTGTSARHVRLMNAKFGSGD